MWRNLRRLLSAFDTSAAAQQQQLSVQLSAERGLQERLDVHRLFLFTALDERQRRDGALPQGFAESVIEQAKALSFEQQREAVDQRLQDQILAQAAAVHESLLEAGDDARAARAFERAAAAAAGGGDGDAGASTSGRAGSGGTYLSQGQLAERAASRLGFSLHVAPSRAGGEQHDAGLGLFVARGAVRAGALLALFPGLVYARADYRRMPGYPKVDRRNPYLIARYDGRITDSQPWGRGEAAQEAGAEPGDGGGGVERAAEAEAHGAQRQPLRPPPPPARRGWLQRVIAASDGPAVAVPPTAWVDTTTGEAAALERLLEGRHPLALAHYANHPGAGDEPNAMVAPFGPWRLWGADGRAAAALRAYVPTLGYSREPLTARDALREGVAGVALVALRPLAAGDEVLFNYRLSPGLAGRRPSWYHPVGGGAEDARRWA